jgi:hypothetical protein
MCTKGTIGLTATLLSSHNGPTCSNNSHGPGTIQQGTLSLSSTVAIFIQLTCVDTKRQNQTLASIPHIALLDRVTLNAVSFFPLYNYLAR